MPARFEQLESGLIAMLCQVARGLAESSGLQMDSASLEAGRVLALCRLDSGKAVTREQWREKMASLEAGAFKDFAAADPLVASAVERSLTRWEPRIDVLKVDARTSADAETVLLIHVDYRIRANNAFHNLVYPFFINEGEG